MKPYDKVSFTNEFGDVIQPGDKVLVIAKGYSGGISTYQGVYLGSRPYSTYYSQEPMVQCVCEVEERVHGKWHPETGNKLPWRHELWDSVEYEHRIQKRITNLWLNLIYPRP